MPGLGGVGGTLPPAQTVAPPAAGDDVEAPIAVNINGNGGKIVVILVVACRCTNEVFTPEVRPFVPKTATDDVEYPVAIYIPDACRLELFVAYPVFPPVYRH